MLILLRHARTSSNAEARLQGRVDTALDDVGTTQARAVGEAINRRWDPDRVVTSSRRRAIQTAEVAGLIGRLPAEVDDRWLEVDFGDYDGRLIAEVLDELGEAWSRDVGHTPPNGESIAAMHERVGRALDDLVESAREQSIVVVTHATPIKSAVTWLLGADVETILRLRVDLASVTAFAPTARGLVLTDYNWCPDRGVVAGAREQIEALDRDAAR